MTGKSQRWIFLAGALVILLALLFIVRLKPRIPDTSTQLPTPIPTLDIVDPGLDTDQNNYVLMALNDLSTRLGVPSSEIRVSHIAEKTFGDTSLGCPKPGVMYAQVLTPGYIIELSYIKSTYTYHAGLETVVTCSDGGK